MIDTAGMLFIGAACFLFGIVFEAVLWDLRAVTEPYTEESSTAINSFYVNATIGTARRAPYLLALMPVAFLVVIGALSYKSIHGLSVGDRHAVNTSILTIVIIFPLIALAAGSTFPIVRRLVTHGSALPLESRLSMHRRLLFEHALYLVLTAGAIVAHVAL